MESVALSQYHPSIWPIWRRGLQLLDTWLDLQRKSYGYGYGYSSFWSLAGLICASNGGRSHHCLVFRGGVSSRAAHWSSYCPQHQTVGRPCNQVFAPGGILVVAMLIRECSDMVAMAARQDVTTSEGSLVPE
jgi:hypothetical protein